MGWDSAELAQLLRIARAVAVEAGAGEAADDVAQTAVHKLTLQDDVEHPAGWVRTVVRREAIDWHRKNKADRRTKWPSYSSSPSAQALPSVESISSPAAAAVTLEGALAVLTPRQREAVELFHLAGLSSAEVAEIMGITPETVNNLVSKAMKQLRDVLDDGDDVVSSLSALD